MPYKVKRPPKSYDIEVLSLAVAALGKEVGELEATNTQLFFRHNILHATCNILEMLGAMKQTGQPGSAETELLAQLQDIYTTLAPSRIRDCDSGSINQPQQEHAQSQLHSNGGSSSSMCGSNNGSNTDVRDLVHLDEHETLGTVEDPLRALRLSLQNSINVNSAEIMTLKDLQQDYQETVNQLAPNLAFLDNPFRRSQTGDNNPFEKVKKLLTRHGRLLTSLLVGGKAHLMPQFMMSDVVTGEQQEELNDGLYDYAVQRLGLSQEQKLRMQATLNCFQGLLSSIVEERTLLQQQLGLPPGFAFAPPSGSRSSSSGSSPGSSMSSGMFQAAAAAAAMCGSASIDPAAKASKATLNKQQQAVRQQQHEQEHKLARIVTLLKKESLLKCCTWVGIEGCLTWVQLAKLATCCYPYPASPIAFAQAVDRHLQQQQQAQQQPQQQQQQAQQQEQAQQQLQVIT